MKNPISKRLVFGFLIFNISCSSYTKTEPLKIIITSDISYKYDLSAGVYSVFYLNKPPQLIKFHLTDDEMKAIYHKYYSLKLDKIKKTDSAKEDIIIIDKCEEMPKNKTILQVQTQEKKQKIQIDVSCSSFYLSNFIEANHVKSFINFVLSIIRMKPEIKKAPLSDIWYI